MLNRKEVKNKVSITAGITAVAILISGTFAWNSFNQEATNKIQEKAQAAAGRLHDDFNGKNKDVYIENYAEEDVIYARIRLDEYMEIGDNAGNDKLPGSDPVEVVRGDKPKGSNIAPSLDDVTSWDTYLYNNGTTSDIRSYYSLSFGGSTIYMPTFNKNSDSLATDINGTLEGPDGNRLTIGDKYDDYQTYTNGQQITDDAVYDIDDNNLDEGDASVEGSNHELIEETHTAKPTLTSTVMSMEQWKTSGSQAGPYWVYDSDGWAYWAEAIEPQTATGLLLTDVSKINSPKKDWFYAINVVSQMATGDDWGTEANGDGFFKDGISDDALELLKGAKTNYEIFKRIEAIEPGSDAVVNIDGNDYYVLRKQVLDGKNAAYLWSKDTVGPDYQFHGTDSSNGNARWATSDLRNYINSDEFIQTYMPSIADRFRTTPVDTYYSNKPYEVSSDKIYLLLNRDFGMSGLHPSTVPSAITTQGIYITSNKVNIGKKYFLRGGRTDTTAYYIDSNGQIDHCNTSEKYGVRPSFWIYL